MQFFVYDLAINESFFFIHDPMIYWTHRCVESLRLYYTPVLVALGLIGNLIHTVALSKLPMHRNSGSPYLQALAIVDIVLLGLVFTVWLALFGLKVFATGTGCHATTLLTSMCNFLSVWLIVGMLTERCLAISGPRRIICTNMKSRITVIVLCVLALVIYLNLCLLYGVLETPAGPVCVPLPHVAIAIAIYRKVDVIINFGIAYACIIIVLVSLTRRTTPPRRPPLGDYRDSEPHLPDDNPIANPEKTVTVLILITSLVFLICSLPGHIFRLITMLVPSEVISHRHLILLLVQQLLLLLFFTRAAVTPWLCMWTNPTYSASLYRAVRDYVIQTSGKTASQNSETTEMTTVVPDV